MLEGIDDILFPFVIRNTIGVVSIWMSSFFHLHDRPWFSEVIGLLTFLIFNGRIDNTHEGFGMFFSPLSKGLVNILRQISTIIVGFIRPTIGELYDGYIIQFMCLCLISIFIRHFFCWQELISMCFGIRFPDTIPIISCLRCQFNHVI